MENKGKKYFDLIHNLNFSFEILLSYFLSVLFLVFFILFLNKVLMNNSNCVRRENFFLTSFSKIFQLINKRKKFRSTNAFFLFLALFNWWTVNLVTNNVKSNKVVVRDCFLSYKLNQIIKNLMVN